jgi:glycosyltransferase involved in cell wall biosynthesis
VTDLSIVIPTWNSAPTLTRLLTSIQAQTQAPRETIAVDNCSTDSTQRVLEAFGVKVYIASSDRSEARNIGASRSIAQNLLFVDADMELTPNVVRSVGSALSNHTAVIVRETVLSGANYWAAARAFEREACFRTTYFEAARGIRRATFMQMGGYRSVMNGLEDMDLQARLMESRVDFCWVDDPIIHDEAGVGLLEYIVRRARYGRADSAFAHEHPEFWRHVISLRERLNALASHTKQKSLTVALRYLPGLVLQRGLEIVSRFFTVAGEE